MFNTSANYYNGKIYVTNNANSGLVVKVFDIATQLWISNLIDTTYNHSKGRAIISENYLYIIGGENTNYSEIKMNDDKVYLESRSMLQWEQCLPEDNFCRISRFYIINLNYMIKIEKIFNIPGLLYIEGIGEPLKISKSYYKKLKLKYR